MRPPERIETNRLALRVPTRADARAIFETYTQDPEVTRYVIWRPNTQIEQAEQFIAACLEAWEGERRFPYIVTLRGRDDPIGMVDFHINGSTVGLGYVFGRLYWGHGYATEAVRAVIDWAFRQPAIYRVHASCDVENAASARVMEKAGMQREGILRRYLVHPNIGDEPRDCYLYAIVK